MRYRYFWLLVIVLALCLSRIGMREAHAQSPEAYTMQGGAAHTTCTTPATGSYFLCVATDGVWVSNNGAAYFQITAAAAAGVTSVQACNLAGTTCATAQTGAVVLDIPTKATAVAPTVTTTVSGPSISGATTLSSVSEPTVTAVASAPSVTLQ